MIRKQTIASLILTVALLYIITPYFFEKKLLFNELLSATGLALLVWKRFRVGNDPVSIAMVLLITWSTLHAIVSLARMDTLYFYLRNSVILYSMMAFFVGFFLFKYLGKFIDRIRKVLRVFIGIFIFIPLPRILFERFGVAMLFPALFKKASSRYIGLLLIIINIIYGISYKSATAIFIASFFALLFISPGYRFFTQCLALVFLTFIAVFIYLQPNLSMISVGWTFYTENPIYNVIGSHPLLGIDGNSTWRLVLWNQLIVDDFPANIFGLGFGTPVLKYYPIEDYSKLETLPYVLGGHNSYVYLFARLGVVYVAITIYIYIILFREYFYHRAYYLANNHALIFWSFFTVSIIAAFNPALETPIYASAYWMLLGFTARAIYHRRNATVTNENIIHT